MNIRSLAVLMWKHGVVRKRKFIHTTVDLLSPILLFVLFYASKDAINPLPPSGFNNAIDKSYTEMLPLTVSMPNMRLGTIFYYPKSNNTDSLMKEVAHKLDLKKIDKFSGKSLPGGYYALTSQEQIEAFKDVMKATDAVVIFTNNMADDTLSNGLNYTIRMKQDFHTGSYEAMDDAPGPHSMFGLNYLLFMRLQCAIDRSYIETQSNKTINQTVYVQEFPYYRAQSKEVMGLICSFLILACFLSLMLTFVFLMCRLLEERTSGIQELIKMVGVSLKSLGLSHFLNVLPIGLVFSITATILLKVSYNPLISNSNGFLIFLMFLLYFNSVVALAFVCSYIIKSSEYAVTIAVISYILLFIPAISIIDIHLPYAIKIISGYLPHNPMIWFWHEVGMKEMYGGGVSFSNMFQATTSQNVCVFLSLVLLLVQAVSFYFLAWYLSLVRPGKYGQALPWNFLFKASKTDDDIKKEVSVMDYQTPGIRCFQVSPQNCHRPNGSNKELWSKNEVGPDSDSAEMELINEGFFEMPPNNMKVGIRVENVTKMYDKEKALKNVSLKAYEGEITVLVGHNGAGKTTLMSIITGMTSATKGKVYVKELDTVEQKAEVRKHIGLCPQHNMFFPDLTLQEHIIFFTLLKRGTYAIAVESAEKLAAQLSLEDKLYENCSALSGGMKRRAQLACALAGGADVLVLDEPTSGLDVETRRELWDLLLSLRGERTVLLSTHFMEEADALGDRVAALHSGELRCFATTMHLKKAIGNGYRLSLTTIGLPKETDITEVVVSHVPDATLKEKTINSISYNLPATANNEFPQLFSDLENKKPELCIDSIGVGVSTLEEVFLKLCSDVDHTFVESEDDDTTPESTQKKLTGFLLYWRQLIVLLKRQLQYTVYKKYVFLILQILLPIIFITEFTASMNNVYYDNNNDMPRKLNLDLYNDRHRRVLYDIKSDGENALRSLTNAYPGVDFEKVDGVASSIFRIGKQDVNEYNKYLSGIELNDTDAKVIYTTTVRHTAPVTLNMLSNMLAMRYIGWSNARINTYNHPIPGYVRHLEVKLEPKTLTSLIIWAFGVIFFIQASILHCVSLPCEERKTGTRHIHIMSGCPPELHWTATLIFHMTFILLFLIIPSILSACLLEHDNTINQTDFVWCLTLILIMGSLSMLAFMYLISFRFNERTTNIILVASIFLFGLVCPLMKTAYDILNSAEPSFGITYIILWICSYIAPPYAMVVSMFQSVIVARLNAWCELSKDQCPNININEIGWSNVDTTACCAGHKPKCYFCMDEMSPMFYIIVLAVQFVFLMTMVFLTQRGIFNGLFDWLRNFNYKTQQQPSSDQMVRAEKTYVEKEITKPPNDIKNDSMLVDDVHKNYVSLIGKSCNAVRGVSFSVKKGECFGLLGVNGAGKSTTFKMLTAEECATRGNIFGNGYHLRAGNSKYLQTLGYCPQFFGLDKFQTGEQNLALVLTLQGLDADKVKEQVQTWIKIVGLEKYANRKVDSYSGGCIRRIGTAAALCGGAALTLLDEPSAGVDVAARRRVWTALRKALKQYRSIVITSHSMDEMETLCSRIAIMCEGQIRALGAPAALRAAYAAGHAVVFKVKNVSGTDEVDGAKSVLNTLKGKLREKFNCSLKDEHKTMLHYHINETMRYSELFTALEALRSEFSNLIEDYSVTETTLEEVFLSLAKEQHHKNEPTPV